MSWRRCAILGILLACAGCSLLRPSGDRFGAREIPFEQLSGWADDNHAQALAAFASGCPLLAKKAREASSGSSLQVPESVWQPLCAAASAIPAGDEPDARQFFEERFVAFRISNNGKENGLFTGYYEPLLYGSRQKKGDFRYPLYAPPPELKNHKPYLTHAQIDQGGLAGRHLEVAWVDDPVMLFFLQIQGSGRIRLEGGQEMLVGYADQNGLTYASLGKIMGDENLIPKDQINFFTLRQWLYAHPDQAMAMMERNPSYVFFKPLQTKGAVGAAGVVLTPERSIAVDSRYIPYGLPVYMETELPALPGGVSQPFDRLMIAQDTGGAIRGPVRADIFFGHGQAAEYLAGYMKGHGVYSLLVPKDLAYRLR